MSLLLFLPLKFSQIWIHLLLGILHIVIFLSFFRESFNEFFYSFDSALNAFELGTLL